MVGITQELKHCALAEGGLKAVNSNASKAIAPSFLISAPCIVPIARSDFRELLQKANGGVSRYSLGDRTVMRCLLLTQRRHQTTVDEHA